MNTALLTVIALGLIHLGVFATWLIANGVSMETLTTAQDHGRFAGLGAAQDSTDGVGRSRPAATPALVPEFARI
ncbi:hypothetical protein [Cupriavidus plantarum]|uniref:Uncharacterized protein n=1 Tax=Cupriavidus plantarum TaxID=942865 RepID=A0A316EWB3_9BURK|nr:hypothetical protein [Cupriavidus plantarum]NYI00811.1 hypothetical protein [Cupriavidus plantarum]PWK35223.1 hypothetical protein C7419_102501 [Cupriavidus plantarum]REE93668.1 hypothetical protein C7418_2438 [Cupriavidus plantarum]RLK39089.1 hypothetical protein C7417_2621 [Cupriavidus plantarum]CAG2135465.1 hypothetical protein LMG26296_02196 [Cupriavidus plantarum]